MSFSSSTKEDLSKLNNLNKKDQVLFELLGYLISSNAEIEKGKIFFVTESEYNINRYTKLLKNCDVNDFKIELKGRAYQVSFSYKKIGEKLANFIDENLNLRVKAFDENSDDEQIYSANADVVDEKYDVLSKVDDNSNEDINEIIIIEKSAEKQNKILISGFSNLNESCAKAIVRGAFLGAGYISNPEKKYHLELNCEKKSNSDLLIKILEKYEISSKFLQKEDGVMLYIKDGEEISKFLAFIGANKSVLEFEGQRVLRDTKNNFNRLINCETANMSKTLNAGKKQVNDILFIKERKKFTDLPDNLKEVAELRLANPEASLQELVTLMNGEISKSGLTHRFAAIKKIADELRGDMVE